MFRSHRLDCQFFRYPLLAVLLLLVPAGCGPEPEWAQDPLLRRVLQQSYSGPRERALRELGELDEASRRAYVPIIAAVMLEDRNHFVRMNAAYTLGRLGPLATEAEPALRMAVRDDEEVVRMMARETLAILGHDTDKMLTDMISEYRRLRTSSGLEQVNRRYAVIGSVVRIIRGTGRVTAPVVAALAEVLDDSDTNVATSGSQGLSAAADANPYVTASAEPALRRAIGHAAMGHIASRTLDKLTAARSRPSVIYMQATTSAIDAARTAASDEEAFSSTMDHMMWYRHLAYEFFADHEIPVTSLDGRFPLHFVVAGEERRFTFENRSELDLIVAYAPQHEPVVIAPIELQTDPAAVLRLLRPAP
jgi:hypothetical protein